MSKKATRYVTNNCHNLLSLQYNRFTVCASKWQVEFFRDQPSQVHASIHVKLHSLAGCGQMISLVYDMVMMRHISLQVKEFIRKAKKWRNEEWPSGGRVTGRPSSYLLSLLVVVAYDRSPYK